MTANTLYGTLRFMVTLDEQLKLQSGLETIRQTLDNLVSSPAQPPQQQALANAMSEFSKSAGRLATSITPSQAGAIAEMGGAEFFDPEIANKITASISLNAMTPSVARDFAQDLATRRAAFLANVKSTLQGLEKLNVKQASLPAGGADVAFLIPRDLFENNLAAFAKELGFISRLLRDVSEGVSGTPEDIRLESLSSSIPTVALGASAAVIVTVATIVNKFLEAWERIEKIRKIRNDLTEIGMKGAAVEELTEQVTTTVEEIVEESTELVLKKYDGHVPGRKNELRNAVSTDIRRLFGQIERGLTVEFHAEPKKDADEESKAELDTIVSLGREMHFPPPTKEPLLLTSGEILEGELHKKTSKKSSTTKTTSVKKDVKKDPEEAKE